MTNANESGRSPEEIAHEAAAWTIRRDRGLTPSEQDDFCQWLAADPRHGEQLACHRRGWKRLDQLVEWRPEHGAQPNPDLLAPPLRSRLVRVLPVSLTLAAAAAAVFAFVVSKPPASKPLPAPAVVTAPVAVSPMMLEDGSIVELNNGATVTVRFTAGERRVRLEKGEAHFTVAKNPARPFIVTARGVDIRAVGTAFNVRVDTAAVEVLVTEGRVQVEEAFEPGPNTPLKAVRALVPPLVPVLTARQRAIVSAGPMPEAPQIATLSLGEIDRVLAWQHRLLELDAMPLAEVVAEFNRRNVVQLVVTDSEIASIRISGSFRTDNIDLLANFMRDALGIRAERRSDTEIVLRKASAGNGP